MPSSALAADGHPSNLQCSGSYTGGTYANVTVPAGDFCSLTDVTVLGNVSVGSDGAEVDLNTSAYNGPLSSSPMTVHGNLVVGRGGYAYVNPGAIVLGTTVVNGAQALQVTQATVHNILSQNGNGLYLSEAEVDGNIASNNPQAGGSISDNTIKGNVVINGGQSSSAFDSWYIDGPPQEIDGNVVLTNNQIPIFIYGNHIKQNLACAGNSPPPSGAGDTNQVDGRSLGQCASL
ncbi:MAG TPA: hypothetical protein VE571_14210 [Solirubrobacteraceae bacterium]|nr:hypothetical protein [Solirubrobacteraceae bacterium]